MEMAAVLALSAGKEQHMLEEPGLYIDGKSRSIWVDGKLRPDKLTDKECKLVLFLASCNGAICTRKETVRAIYECVYDAKIDDGRLDAVVGRARKKIEDNPRDSRFLLTINRHGHRLQGYNGKAKEG
jgi:DNA-binding response OmpR family regulator